VFSEPLIRRCPLVNETIEQFCCDTEQSSSHCSHAESAGVFAVAIRRAAAMASAVLTTAEFGGRAQVGGQRCAEGNPNVAMPLSRSRDIGTFWGISVRLLDPQIIDFAHLSRRTPGTLDK
jgi:hypothetical protein